MLPLAGSAHLALGTPTDEVLRLRPLLKFFIICLATTVAAEVIAGFLPAAITDVLTVVYGAMLLRRDMEGLVQGLHVISVIAALNCALQAFSLLQILLGKPGAKYFLANECVVSVSRIKEGQPVYEHLNLCSWHTVLGNLAMCAAVIFEFLCARLSWRMFKSQEAASMAMAGLLDIENHGSMRGGRVGLMGEELHSMPTATIAASSTGDARSGRQLPVAGFTPFQGQPHRMVD